MHDRSTQPQSLPPSDVDKLLELAESMQRELDLAASQDLRLKISAAIAAIWLLTGGAFAATLFEAKTGWHGAAIILGGGALYCVLGFAFAFRLRPRSRQRLRDRRALDSIVDLVREVEATYSDQEAWTPWQRAQFRIRMSRFDIGEMQPRTLSVRSKLLRPFPSKNKEATLVFRSGGETIKSMPASELHKSFKDKTGLEISEIVGTMYLGKELVADLWVSDVEPGTFSGINLFCLTSHSRMIATITVHVHLDKDAGPVAKHLVPGDCVNVRGFIVGMEKWSISLDQAEVSPLGSARAELRLP